MGCGGGCNGNKKKKKNKTKAKINYVGRKTSPPKKAPVRIRNIKVR